MVGLVRAPWPHQCVEGEFIGYGNAEMAVGSSSDSERFPFDKSSKWLIQHHGDAILRLAGVSNVAAWRALQAELVQPRRLPDGLLEVRLAEEKDADLFLLELATYPDRRVAEQIVRDTMLVFLDRAVLPEVLVVVLCPKGNLRVDSSNQMQSRRGWTGQQTTWRVVELWNLPASDLLALGDPGIVPWVPLMKFDGPAEPVFNQCREIIDHQGKPEEKENLLAVTQILARLRYNADEAKALFGGRQPMIESPLIKELVEEAQAEAKQQDIIGFLESRFGPLSEAFTSSLRGITDVKRLNELVRLAGRCADLPAFEKHLQPK
jgi:hypothetical protein